MSKTIPEFDEASTPQSSDLMLIWQNGLKRAALGDVAGLVVESGSNSDGHWVRFADGTQICRRRITIDHTGTLSSDSRLAGEWDFPQVFAAGGSTTTQMTLPANTSAAFVGCSRTEIISWGVNSGAQLTGVAISVFFDSGTVSTENASITDIQLTATGRWF